MTNSDFTPRFSFGVAVNGKNVIIINGNTASSGPLTSVLNGAVN